MSENVERIPLGTSAPTAVILEPPGAIKLFERLGELRQKVLQLTIKANAPAAVLQE